MKIEIELTKKQIAFLSKHCQSSKSKDISPSDTVQAVINAFCNNDLVSVARMSLTAMRSYYEGYDEGYDDGYDDGYRKGYQNAEDDYCW